ncbi:MAG: Type 1 glutamine amidotransferase-like domain-containing protein [Patescibacteria group bacterium]
MKLFLASSIDQTATLLKHKLPKSKKVLFVANAADDSKSDKSWIKLDREAFIKLGCDLIEVDLRTISKEDFVKYLETSNIIHFCGGSVLYLISLIREKGFDKIIVEFVRKNKIVYSGSSAGSMIVAQDLALSAFDTGEEQFAAKMKDFSGLGLTDFLIIPHASNNEFAEGNRKIVEQLAKYSQPLIFLYDRQAIWVEDEKFEILSV